MANNKDTGEKFTIAPEPEPTIDNTLLDMQRESLALDLEEKRARKHTKEETEAMHAAVRIQTLEKVKRTDKETENRQFLCTHVKPNGKSALAGQKTHSKEPGLVYILLCQYCQKEFNELNVPPMLRVSQETVGGPTN